MVNHVKTLRLYCKLYSFAPPAPPPSKECIKIKENLPNWFYIGTREEGFIEIDANQPQVREEVSFGFSYSYKCDQIWTSLADDMVSYFLLKVPITKSLKEYILQSFHAVVKARNQMVTFWNFWQDIENIFWSHCPVNVYWLDGLFHKVGSSDYIWLLERLTFAHSVSRAIVFWFTYCLTFTIHRSYESVWPEKNRQMSIKVAQKWFH